MDKESSIKVARVLRDAQTALLTVTEERDKLAAENVQLKQRESCAKLASAMHQKGLEADRSPEELVSHLEKEAQAGHLDEISRAVDMVGPNMSFTKVASNNDVPGGAGEGDALSSYLLGQIG